MPTQCYNSPSGRVGEENFAAFLSAELNSHTISEVELPSGGGDNFLSVIPAKASDFVNWKPKNIYSLRPELSFPTLTSHNCGRAFFEGTRKTDTYTTAMGGTQGRDRGTPKVR